MPDPGTEPSTAGDRFGDLTDEIGRRFLGIGYAGGRPGGPVLLGQVTVWLALVAALVALVAHRRSVARLLMLRRHGRRPFDIVLLAVPVTVVAYTASRYAWFSWDPRYLFCAYPILILALAGVPPRRSRPGVVAAVAVVLFVGAPSVATLVDRSDGGPTARDRQLERAVDVLVAEGNVVVYADYWTAMPLQFVAGDRLTVGALNAVRFPGDRRAVDEAASPVWVAAHSVGINDIAPMRDALRRAGVGHRERRIGGVSIFDLFARPVRPWEIGLGVAPAPE
jgi:hypothetical protein